MELNINNKLCDIRYNNGYDCYIIWDGEKIHFIYKGNELSLYIKQSSSGRSYPIVSFPDRNDNYAHKLIAYSWYGKGNKGDVVNHIDNNPFNMNPSNLEYITQSENVRKSKFQTRDYNNQLSKFKADYLM